MKKLFRLALIFILIVAPLFLRAYLEAKNNFESGAAAEKDGDVSAAVDYYVESARWRAPFNHYPSFSVERLFALSEGVSETRGKVEVLSLLRSSLMSTRSFFTVSDEAEKTSLVSVEEKLKALDPNYFETKIVDNRPPRVDYKWQFVSQLFFWAWIGMVFLLIWKGFDSEGRARALLVLRLGTLSWICYLGWLFALSNA
jgi:hypothetical protein